jgi:hypothetical protein
MTDTQTIIIKANGEREAFDPEKLRASLLRAGASQGDADKVTLSVVGKLKAETTTTEIYRHAFQELRGLHHPAAAAYSLRRAIMDLGPTGFPFERFVAEIFKAKGFETLTDQTVLGGCVEHEVDVVAWDAKQLIMCEAKFHNEFGLKSDLKVVLYVKARFDDLKDNIFDYGGKGRKLDEGWLVTNTKFSTTAIRYGVCQKLVMIGWNYPEKGNLQDMIVEARLHPITSLTTLSLEDRKALAAADVVLCSTVKDNPGVLKQVLGPNFDDGPVIEELNNILI